MSKIRKDILFYKLIIFAIFLCLCVNDKTVSCVVGQVTCLLVINIA